MDLVGRGVGLQRAGSGRSLGHAATQVVVERLLDLLLPLGLAVWLLSRPAEASAHGLYVPLLWIAVCAALFVPLIRPGATVALAIYAWARDRARGLGRGGAAASAEDDLPRDEVALAPATAARVAALSVARLATVTLQFYGAAFIVGLAPSPGQMLGATGVAALTGLVGLTPGGLGVIEWGWAGAFRHLGVDGVDVARFVLCQRLCVITNFGLLSLLASARRSNATTTP